jgi:hypothetical protein
MFSVFSLRGGLAALLMPLPLSAGRLYYVNQPENQAGKVQAAALDGGGHTTILTASVVTDLRGLAVDPVTDTFFLAWSEQDASLNRLNVSLRRYPAAGGEGTVMASFPDNTFLGDVEWEGGSGWVYFSRTLDHGLWKIRPDGSQASLVLTHTTAQDGPYFLGLDPDGGFAYWGVLTNPGDTGTAYSRGQLDGTPDAAFSLVTPSRTRDIAVDAGWPGTRLFWNDRQNGATYWRAVAGGAVGTARTGMNAPHGLALDLEAGKAYVADTGKRGSGSQPSAHRVVRFNIDGSGTMEFLSPSDVVAEPWDLAIDLTSVSYADWRTRFFAVTSVAGGPDDDADGDGSANFAEYAFFTNPLVRDAYRSTVQPMPGGIRYARRRTSDVTLRVEVSSDLANWHWNGDGSGTVWTVETPVPRDDDSEWVTSQATSPVIRWFRLRAQR